MHLKFKRLYNWHHANYHILGKLIFYREEYPAGTLKSDVIKKEKDYQEDHPWCANAPDILCVEPVISDWQYPHYCGFTFYFKNNKLVKIISNSPCH
jgi:hypothetical protein